ncbi:MAG: TIGR04283 family arsenosugar biosynthesis glycosyltransferase [Planctomycetota bacterium]|nr:TIGR04283 family arsenosugar biosynthesis glycosyltransferase [Planctomycetota bacterium]MDA1114322.1 TIGR04283 family arsenosugar biosynthesis glycosyltransferase [Planctomycetota bacterium]
MTYPQTPLSLSVIIPTLNEEFALPGCLQAIKAQQTCGLKVKVLLVDGGSTDDTISIGIEGGADAVLESEPGRGVQLRAGADAATGDILLFLHADSWLPPTAFLAIKNAVDQGHPAGAFYVHHVLSENAGPMVKRLVGIADARSRKTSMPYGDQAVFVTASLYAEVGGMPEQPLMEDLEFAKRLNQRSRFHIVSEIVRTSARRFELQPIRSVLCWWSFPTLYRWGVSPQRLMKMYGHPRSTRK